MKLELLAPAGGRDALTAAVQNGADAVYLGVGSFNARRSADNFDEENLRETVDYCHDRGVKVHVTLNTMVRDNELQDLKRSAERIALAQADAVIVQDLGVVRLLREIAPELSLHASTQMAVHNRAGVEFLRDKGLSRVVLARELTLEEIKSCCDTGVEIEAFVHGALCVACSGQCLMSSMIGGRSGNRGRCAQPCRLPYAMDGKQGYLLSTRDLCMIDHLDELQAAGVASLKIEGRLKRPEYVAVMTRAYREALDHPEKQTDIEPLRQMFNRGGFTDGYFHGVNDVQLMYADRPNHVGVSVGSAVRKGAVELTEAVEQADALVLRNGNEDRPVHLSDAPAGSTVPCKEARMGDHLIRLVSEKQMREAKASFEGEHKTVAIDGKLSLHVDAMAELTVTDGVYTAKVTGETVSLAQNRPADRARLKAQLEKTGGTVYTFDSIDIDVDDMAYYPVSGLNALRREALDKLSQARRGADRTIRDCELPTYEPYRDGKGLLAVQSAIPERLKEALDAGADRAIYAPTDIRTAALEGAIECLPQRFSLALPAVMTDNTLHLLNDWAQRNAVRIEKVYISNIGQFGVSWPGEIVADAPLNIANRLSVAAFREWGAVAVNPSVELTTGEIRPLQGERELIVHGRLPLMYLRHCPYRAVHGLKGKHAACRHCDGCAASERLEGRNLVDRTGTAFPLSRIASDDGCVIMLKNSVPLNLLKRFGKLPTADVYRILDDGDESIAQLVQAYRAAMNGQTVEWHEGATTTGHYFRGVE